MSTGTRTYVLDTSVMLSDPQSPGAFGEHDVVIPIVALVELEAKRHHPELGWAARSVLRRLEQLRVEHGSISSPVPVNDDRGTVRVELNHQETAKLPPGLLGGSNDHRILAVAKNLSDEGADVVLVTKDLPLRLKASIVGLRAEEYRRELAGPGAERTGMIEVPVTQELIDGLHRGEPTPLDADIPVNTGVLLRSPSGSALARLRPDKTLRLLDGRRDCCGITPRSAEQRIALDLLADPNVGVVSLGGPAGTGKSVLALAAGLREVGRSEGRRGGFDRVVVFRPIFAVGGQDLGYLPGDAGEKMAPWADATWDAVEAIVGVAGALNIKARQIVEVSPLTYIRGRSLTNAWIIIDEAQNLERNVLLTALSRVGEGSKVVLTHDVAQRDNLRVGRHDGIASVVESLSGSPLFGHVTLRRSERSAIAELATSVLGGPDAR